MMKTTFQFSLLLSLCLIIGRSSAQLTAAQLKAIDSISMQDVVKGGPGIATGMVQNGKVIYTRYAGHANLTDSSLITEHSRFNIASNAKQFTAFAILNLISEDKLNITDDIRIYLPKLYPTHKGPITVANLLGHTSGIRDVYDLWSLKGLTWWKQSFSNSDAIKLLQGQRDLNFTPGTKYMYSNSNYILLAEIVSKVSGQSFTAYTNQLFSKLGMAETSFTEDYRRITGTVARPYFNFDTWTGYNWTCNIQGDGNLFSTLADQLRWESLLQTKESAYFSPRLLAMTQELIKGSATSDYGYGLEFGTFNGTPYVFHEGSTGAWKATTLRFPSMGYAIVTLTNSGKAITSLQSRQTAAVLLNSSGKKKGYATAPEREGKAVSMNEVAGTYQDENDFTFRLEVRDSALYLLRFGRNDTKLERESANTFHQWNDPSFKQEFKLNGNGEMEVTAYYTSHAPYTLKRDNVDWSGFDPTQLNGTYANKETGVTLKIKSVAGRSYQLKLNGEKTEAILISPSRLLTDNYTINFTKENKGLLLDGERMKNLNFTKSTN